MNVHMRDGHNGEKPLKCKFCGVAFEWKSNFYRHLKTHTNEGRYKCEICFANFSRLEYKKIHLRSHTGEKPFKCDICLFAFNDPSAFRRHKKLRHKEERPYKCGICDAAFKLNIDFESHLLTHTNEMSYQCDVCLATFEHISSLNRHLQTHTQEGSFKCPTSAAVNLKKYLVRVHTNERRSVQRHLHHFQRIHNKDNPHKCLKCDESFGDAKRLSNHEERVHITLEPQNKERKSVIEWCN